THVGTQPGHGYGHQMMQIDRRRPFEAGFGSHDHLAAHAANRGGERCDGNRMQAADHILPGQDQDGPAPVRAWEGELPDLSTRYFGHTWTPMIGPNSLRRTGRRA